MKRLLFSVLVLAAAGAGVWYYANQQRVMAAPEVVNAPASRGSIVETVQATGTIEPIRRVNVGSQVSGVVTGIYADFNSVVTQGQLLAEIDPSPYELQVQIQEAAIARQTNDIASQEHQLADLRRQLDRAWQLFDRGLQNRVQLEAVDLNVKTRESQVESAKNQLVQARANLAAAQLNLGYTKIFSPIDGIVINRRVDIGQAVQASMTTPSFFMLSTPLQVMKLTAQVDEADVGRVRPGMTVRFRVNTFGPELFTGVVEAVRLNAMRANEVVTYPVWIHVPNQDMRLRPGMTATVLIEVSEAREVVRVPNEALRFRPSRAVYEALGVPAFDHAPVRAVDRIDPRNLSAPSDIVVDSEATSIDELFQPLPRPDARGTVWTWRAETRELSSRPVRVGVSDGALTELIEGDIQPGDQLVTGVVLPQIAAPTGGANPLMGPQRGGPGRAGGSR
jgi:HlyD family secretion protein